MKIKRKLKFLFINSFVLVFVALLGELISRSFFPEFIGDYSSSKVTRSINFHTGKYKGLDLARVSHPKWSINKNFNMVVVVGGSISKGYGTRYEDIYWVQLKNLNNLVRNEKIEVIPFGDFGSPFNNLNTAEDIRMISSEFNNKEKYIIYQFNYSDLFRLSRNDTNKTESSKNLISTFDTFIRKITIKHFHKSVLVRVSKNYLGLLKRSSNKYKNCEEKGWSSLQEYSYAYGSKGFEKESDKAWKNFSHNIATLKTISDELNAKFIMFITPSNFDIDIEKKDKFYNTYGFDFSCATIDPRQKLREISEENNIDFLDPTNYIREKFNANLKEGNFKRFYFASDNSHITPVASSHLSDYLFSKIFFPQK